eukprot:gene12216-5802_t
MVCKWIQKTEKHTLLRNLKFLRCTNSQMIKGNAYAQFLLGFFFQQSAGVKTDSTKAVKYYKLSSEKGNSNAQNNLGI